MRFSGCLTVFILDYKCVLEIKYDDDDDGDDDDDDNGTS